MFNLLTLMLMFINNGLSPLVSTKLLNCELDSKSVMANWALYCFLDILVHMICVWNGLCLVQSLCWGSGTNSTHTTHSTYSTHNTHYHCNHCNITITVCSLYCCHCNITIVSQYGHYCMDVYITLE